MQAYSLYQTAWYRVALPFAVHKITVLSPTKKQNPHGQNWNIETKKDTRCRMEKFCNGCFYDRSLVGKKHLRWEL